MASSRTSPHICLPATLSCSHIHKRTKKFTELLLQSNNLFQIMRDGQPWVKVKKCLWAYKGHPDQHDAIYITSLYHELHFKREKTHCALSMSQPSLKCAVTNLQHIWPLWKCHNQALYHCSGLIIQHIFCILPLWHFPFTVIYLQWIPLSPESHFTCTVKGHDPSLTSHLWTLSVVFTWDCSGFSGRGRVLPPNFRDVIFPFPLFIFIGICLKVIILTHWKEQ